MFYLFIDSSEEEEKLQNLVGLINFMESSSDICIRHGTETLTKHEFK